MPITLLLSAPSSLCKFLHFYTAVADKVLYITLHPLFSSTSSSWLDPFYSLAIAPPCLSPILLNWSVSSWILVLVFFVFFVFGHSLFYHYVSLNLHMREVILCQFLLTNFILYVTIQIPPCSSRFITLILRSQRVCQTHFKGFKGLNLVME